MLYGQEHTAFPYTDVNFPFKDDLSKMGLGDAVYPATKSGRISFKYIGERSVTREWTAKPGKRLYVEFINRSKVLLKNDVCEAKGLFDQ